MHRADILPHRPLLNWCGSEDIERVHSYKRPLAQDLDASDDEDSVTNAAAGELGNIHIASPLSNDSGYSPQSAVSAGGRARKSMKSVNHRHRNSGYESLKSRSSASYQHAPILDVNGHRIMPNIEEEVGSEHAQNGVNEMNQKNQNNRQRESVVDAASVSDVISSRDNRDIAISRRIWHNKQGSSSASSSSLWADSQTHGKSRSIPLIIEDEAHDDEEKQVEIEVECVGTPGNGRDGRDGRKAKKSVVNRLNGEDEHEADELDDGEFKAHHKRMSSSEIRLQNWQLYSEEVQQSNESSPKHC